MRFLQERRKRKIFTIVLSVFLALVFVVTACAFYLGDYYHADEGAIVTFAPTENITVSTLNNGNVIFEPQGATTGFIFYPGGKVDHDAYQPLMAELAREGILCVLVEMPFRLSVLDVNAADGIREQYPKIEKWYIGGHSLGGSMAASYLVKHADEYEGLVLLGAYSTADLSETDLDILSVYGSEDNVMNREKYDANPSNLPSNFSEVEIEGGCHAYFGMYGAQDGDGTPTIGNHDQIRITAKAITELMK